MKAMELSQAAASKVLALKYQCLKFTISTAAFLRTVQQASPKKGLQRASVGTSSAADLSQLTCTDLILYQPEQHHVNELVSYKAKEKNNAFSARRRSSTATFTARVMWKLNRAFVWVYRSMSNINCFYMMSVFDGLMVTLYGY